MNTEATLQAEPEVTEKPEAEVKATEQAAIESPPPAEESESDKAAKAQAKIDRRFAQLTKQKYAAEAKAEALERMYAQAQQPQGESPDTDGDLIERVRQEVSRDFELRQQQKVVDTVFREAKIDKQEFVETFPELTTKETAMTVQAIIESDIAPKIIKHLYDNPDEAERLANLSPSAQVKEIGRIEERLSAPKPAVKKSGAPAPIVPIGGNAKSDGYREDMTQKEYEEWRNRTSKRR